MRAITGTSDGWQDLVLPADATGATSAITSAELSLVLPGKGTVEVAMPAQLDVDATAAAIAARISRTMAADLAAVYRSATPSVEQNVEGTPEATAVPSPPSH
jgi:hypothetical protein